MWFSHRVLEPRYGNGKAAYPIVVTATLRHRCRTVVPKLYMKTVSNFFTSILSAASLAYPAFCQCDGFLIPYKMIFSEPPVFCHPQNAREWVCLQLLVLHRLEFTRRMLLTGLLLWTRLKQNSLLNERLSGLFRILLILCSIWSLVTLGLSRLGYLLGKFICF